jgi:hypothetical protein
MLINEFDELMETKPFSPFTLITADGRAVTDYESGVCVASAAYITDGDRRDWTW